MGSRMCFRLPPPTLPLGIMGSPLPKARDSRVHRAISQGSLTAVLCPLPSLLFCPSLAVQGLTDPQGLARTHPGSSGATLHSSLTLVSCVCVSPSCSVFTLKLSWNLVQSLCKWKLTDHLSCPRFVYFLFLCILGSKS